MLYLPCYTYYGYTWQRWSYSSESLHVCKQVCPSVERIHSSICSAYCDPVMPLLGASLSARAASPKAYLQPYVMGAASLCDGGCNPM